MTEEVPCFCSSPRAEAGRGVYPRWSESSGIVAREIQWLISVRRKKDAKVHL